VVRGVSRLVAVILLAVLPGASGGAAHAQESIRPQQLLHQASTDLQIAIERYDSNAIAAAADSIRRVIEANPQFGEAWVRLGEALLWLGDYARAGDAFQRASALRYRAVDLPLLQARLAVLQGDLAAAGQIYDGILAATPYNEEARVGRAVLNLSAGTTDAAVRTLQELSRRFPENRQLLAALTRITYDRGDLDQFERYLQLALQYHGDAASIQLLAADYAIRQGDFERATFHARNATSLAPDLADAWLILARAAIGAGEPDRALAHYEELIRIDPTDHRAWYARGELLAGNGSLDDARRSWNRALEIRPDFELARIALENTVIDELPLDDSRRAELAAAYRESGRQLQARYLSRQAERHYRRGLQLNPFDGVLRARIAELYLQQGMNARYLEELTVIRDRGLTGTAAGLLTDQQLQDRIDVYTAALRDSVAVSWSVDQFTAPRPRTAVAVVVRQSAGEVLPGADRHVARYVGSLLQSSQNVDVTATAASAQPGSRLVGAYRRQGADLLALIDYAGGDRSVDARLRVIRTATAETVTDVTVRRSGNGRVDAVASTLAAAIEAQVVPRGTVLQRNFERVLISLGAVDGLQPDDSVAFTAQPAGTDLGTGTIAAVDDLVAEAVYRPDGPDNLTTGDMAVAVPPQDQNSQDAQASGADAGQNNGTVPLAVTENAGGVEQTSQLRETVQQLFQIR